MSIWGNMILPQKDGFIYGANEPGVPCLWFNTGGGAIPADPDVNPGLLMYRDNEDLMHPLYPMTKMSAVHGLNAALDNLKTETQKISGGIRCFSATFSVPASGWTGDTAPYIQSISLPGILDTDNPHYGIVLSGTVEQKLEQLEAYGCINELKTADGIITFTCLEEKPATDITIQIEVNRWCGTVAGFDGVAMLLLDANESGYITIASIDGEDYGIKNASVNIGATNSSYDFTII